VTTKTSTREQIHRIVDTLSLKDLEDLLDYLNQQADPDVLSPEEKQDVLEGEAQLARGESITLEESRARRAKA
jgi:hypothetical protein